MKNFVFLVSNVRKSKTKIGSNAAMLIITVTTALKLMFTLTF